jgi:hypothetical protein
MRTKAFSPGCAALPLGILVVLGAGVSRFSKNVLEPACPTSLIFRETRETFSDFPKRLGSGMRIPVSGWLFNRNKCSDERLWETTVQISRDSVPDQIVFATSL